MRYKRLEKGEDIDAVIVGCSSAEEVQMSAVTGRYAEPLSFQERSRLVQVFEPYASRLAYYRGKILEY